MVVSFADVFLYLSATEGDGNRWCDQSVDLCVCSMPQLGQKMVRYKHRLRLL